MKDLFLKMIKSVFEALFKVALEAVKGIDYKKVAYNSYIEFKPALQKKVDDTASKVDNTIVKALDIIVDKFLKPDEKNV